MEERAISKSSGKPKLLDIHKWLDQDFLLEMARGMRDPVEVLKKYPKNNWKLGAPDCEFAALRLESAMRHLVAHMSGELVDSETGIAHLAMAANNLMMVFYHSNCSQSGVEVSNNLIVKYLKYVWSKLWIF